MEIIKQVFGNDGEQIGDSSRINVTLAEVAMVDFAKQCLRQPGKIIPYKGSAFSFQVDRFGYNAVFRQYNENKGGDIVATGCYFDGPTDETLLLATGRMAGRKYYAAINRDNDRDTAGVEAAYFVAIPEPSPAIRLTSLRGGRKMTLAMPTAFAIALAKLLLLRQIDTEGAC